MRLLQAAHGLAGFMSGPARVIGRPQVRAVVAYVAVSAVAIACALSTAAVLAKA